MRPIFVLFFATLYSFLLNAQTSLDDIGLQKGTYAVGFQHKTVFDSTRTYSRIYDYTRKKIPRPIAVSIWYPSHTDSSSHSAMTVLDYFEILKEEEEWEHLPNEQLLNWFSYANTPENQKHLKESTSAVYGSPYVLGKYPVIIYAPSFQASSIENFALCEYLASHGFLVISSPSRGTETRWFGPNNAKEAETQARDIEFLIKEVGKLSASDDGKIALMGFSFGGLSNVIVQNRNDNIKAVISLDGTERYQYQLLQQSPFFDAQKLDVPYLHMAQKEIPPQVLKEDHIDPELNTKFDLFDSIRKSDAFKLRFHDLTHSYFSTFGVLFATRDERQDKSDEAIMQSYRLMARYTLDFLDAFVKKDERGMDSFAVAPLHNAKGSTLVSIETKKADKSIPSFEDFNEMASAQNYNELTQLYESLVKKYPSFQIPEGHLNLLGLQLVFNNPETPRKGIKVFLFATQLYPESSNLFDSLAEGYLYLGKKELALESFEKSLKLNGENQNAINRLKQLKGN